MVNNVIFYLSKLWLYGVIPFFFSPIGEFDPQKKIVVENLFFLRMTLYTIEFSSICETIYVCVSSRTLPAQFLEKNSTRVTASIAKTMGFQ